MKRKTKQSLRNETWLRENHNSKSEKKVKNQFHMNNKLSKSIEKDKRNHKKYQTNTSKLRINIQQSPRTTFDDIEKRNPR